MRLQIILVIVFIIICFIASVYYFVSIYTQEPIFIQYPIEKPVRLSKIKFSQYHYFNIRFN